MRWDNLYVAGVGVHLPERVETAEQAIAMGRYTPEKLAMNGFRAVRVAPADQTGPMLAAAAGRQAVARSGVSPDRIGLLVHTYQNHQGLDFWPPASFVQRETIGGSAPAVEMGQLCNGFMMAIEMAGCYLRAEAGGGSAALITGGDVWRLPYIDRWETHPQNVYGDGGGAMVLSTSGGFARVRATVSFSDSSLEPVSRLGRPWSDAPFANGKPAQFREALEGVDMDETVEKISTGVRHSMESVLREAEVELSDMRFVLHGQVPDSIAEFGLYQLLGIDRRSTAFDWGQDYGLVSTVNMVLGFNHLIAEREPKPGDLVLFLGSAAGYSWTSLVLEFLDVPDWA
ncbi:ketoacyl-ACP synthase III family protein [Allorhizocola rhizosphaerae]|uniref:ketoacyl-ACP synthase III family protein n=1 Tax=Allorhizocola rhizosphaerae TaxID=1872709 RepID=UPI000E3E55DF|nr:ketoacyl-ACP synthase III family protein [Allorhizocola rhizosphaerae]